METSSSETSGKRNAGDNKNKYLHLKKKRLSYPKFKAQVIHDREGWNDSYRASRKILQF